MKAMLLTLSLWLVCSVNFAQETEPLLVLNTGGHTALINDLLFTPSGNQIISVSNDKTIRLWDIETGKLERTLRAQIGEGQEGMLYCSAISGNGKLLAVAGYPARYGIRVYNLDEGEQTSTLIGNVEAITALNFSPDGKLIASGSTDGVVRLWKVIRPWGEVRATAIELKHHQGPVLDLAFNGASDRLASVSVDNSMVIWDVSDIEHVSVVADVKSHRGAIKTVAYSSDGDFIATGGEDMQILLWDNAGVNLGTVDHLNEAVQSISFSENGQKMVAMKRDGWVYSIPDGERLIHFNEHNNTVMASAFWKNDVIATAGGHNNEIFVWDANTGAMKQRMSGDGKSVFAVAFGEDLKIAFGQTSEPIDVNNRGPLEKCFDFESLTYEGAADPEDGFERVILVHDSMPLIKSGNLLAIGGKNQQILRDIDPLIRSYTYTRDGNVVVGTDFTLKKFAPDGTVIQEYKGHVGHVWAVSVSKDNKYLVSSSDDQTIKLWNLETGENLATLFVSNDGEWVCWSKNYFKSTTGGEKYIGWHRNMGVKEIAEFYEFYTYRKKYFKPFVVRAAVKLGSFDQALKNYQNTLNEQNLRN